MRVYLIRHGQTDWNVQRRFQGSQDIPLNEEGIRQARLIAGRFTHMQLSRIYHSPLMRARQTAQILARECPAPLVCVPQLREIGMGAWEGLTHMQIQETMPEAYREYAADRKHNGAPGGGESFLALAQRAMPVMESLVAQESADFAVVAHGAILKAIFCTYLHIDLSHLDAFDVSNGSVSTVEFEAGHAKVITLNDLSHLPDGDMAGNRAVL